MKSNGLILLLFDGLEVVRVLLLSLAGDEMDSKSLAQLLERVNKNQFQTGMPMSGHPLQSGRKSLAQDSIKGFLKEHDCSKAIDMISRVRSPIVALQLRNLKV